MSRFPEALQHPGWHIHLSLYLRNSYIYFDIL
jgi:hypothetical protein